MRLIAGGIIFEPAAWLDYMHVQLFTIAFPTLANCLIKASHGKQSTEKLLGANEQSQLRSSAQKDADPASLLIAYLS
jgi:hypothetical protein